MDPLPSLLRQQHLAQLTGADADAVNAQSFPATWRVGASRLRSLGSMTTSFLLCPLPCRQPAIPLFTACNHIGGSGTAAE